MTPGPAVWLELFASTVYWFLSRITVITYLSSHIFLLRRRAFTSRKLFACLERLLYFLQLSDRTYASGARCRSLFFLWSFWHHRIQIQLFTYKSVDCLGCCICLCSASLPIYRVGFRVGFASWIFRIRIFWRDFLAVVFQWFYATYFVSGVAHLWSSRGLFKMEE